MTNIYQKNKISNYPETGMIIAKYLTMLAVASEIIFLFYKHKFL
jgi:hypothetical protein